MHITFGMHVGAWRGPGSRAHLGQPIVARPALLGLLETHLGLSGAPVSSARRAAAYLLALRAADNQQRFYHRSLQADEVGTATQLLRRRDELMLAGWDGQGQANWRDRLADLAAVETVAAGQLPLGEGERLAAVAQRLRIRRVPISSVLLLDPVDAFPARWQDVLELLPVRAVEAPRVAGAGDLGLVQAACIQATSQPNVHKAPDLAGDGSLIVLRPLSCEEAEHWLADHCRRNPEPSRMVVADNGGPSVDDTLRAQGLPACGFDDPSVLRPALQALPLALETLWDPVEPPRLLDFLTHPIGPVHATARRLLADAFARQPGIGGREWLKAREQIAQELGSDTVEQVAFWLESARHPRAAGAPLDDVLARVTRMQAALQLRLAGLQARDAEQSLVRDVATALGQCSQLMEGLDELRKDGNTLVKPRALEQLTEHATADSSNPLSIPQIGCMQSATATAACAVEAADEVLWWMPARPQLPASLPWVGKELGQLAAAGLRMRDPAAEMAALMAQWVRPVLAARRRLVLMLPPEGSEEHPAWQLLRAMCPGLPAQPLQAYAVDTGQLAEVNTQLLPAPRGVWTLNVQAAWRTSYPVPTRMDAQSFSSLNVLFNNPAITVLSDAARLDGGTTLAVEDDNRLLGNLAHRLLELLFAQDGSLQWDEEQVNAWFGPAVRDVLRREGLPLLARGSAVRLQHFRDSSRRSISALLQHLRHAKVVRVQAERKLVGDISGLETAGRTDLMLFLEDGKTVALDLKWSSAGPFRARMEEGDFLQLALYAHMIEQELGAAPVAVGFFTFVDATLLTFTPNLFAPSARIVIADTSLAEVIEAAVQSWNWRAQQWQEGRVEVVAEGLEPGPTRPPSWCLPLHELGPWYADYVAFFGHKEDA